MTDLRHALRAQLTSAPYYHGTIFRRYASLRPHIPMHVIGVSEESADEAFTTH